MESGIIICNKCGEMFSSKRSLKRHLINRHPVKVVGVVDSRCVEIVDTVGSTGDLTLPEVPSTVASDDAISTDNPGVIQNGMDMDEAQTTDKQHLDSVARMQNGRLVALRRNKVIIKRAVDQLLREHNDDHSTLLQPTVKLVDKLRKRFETARLPREVFIGVVIAAKQFAGSSPTNNVSRAPRRFAAKSESKQRDMSPVLHVKRQLFADHLVTITDEDTCLQMDEHTDIFPEDCSSIPLPFEEAVSEIVLADDPVAATSFASATTTDEEWCMDIWRSYGTGELQLPSPIGCQLSPSVIFSSSDMPPSTPVEFWSSSSDEEQWGPDSPDEELEAGSQPLIPEWPVFTDDNGEVLDHQSSTYQERLAVWTVERSRSTVRLCRKKRHPLRSRHIDREQYKSALQHNRNRQNVEMSDIALPSPPENNSSLLQLRRRIVMTQSLPKGCRIQPPRSSKRKIPEELHVNPDPDELVHEEDLPQQSRIRRLSSSKIKSTVTLPDIDFPVYDDIL